MPPVHLLSDHPLAGISQRVPPANLAAEQALLGAILANNKAYDRVSEFLAPAHFADPVHALIYERLGVRIERGTMADAAAATEACETAAKPTIPTWVMTDHELLRMHTTAALNGNKASEQRAAFLRAKLGVSTKEVAHAE